MRFIKQILRPGRVLATTPDKKRKIEVFTPERIKKQGDTLTEMIAAGIKIPLPWGHDGATPTEFNPQNNAGFWDKFFVDPLDQCLYGEVDVPIAADAEKLGATVREVSPFIKPKWTDGSGREWKDVPVHIAAVVHPVQAGQLNFTPKVEADQSAIALSLYMAPLGVEVSDDVLLGLANDELEQSEQGGGKKKTVEEGSDPNAQRDEGVRGAYAVKDALAYLRKMTPPLDLPDDTTGDNFLERVCIACIAIMGQNQGDGTNDTKVKELPTPIAMSLTDTEGNLMPEVNQALLDLATTQAKGGYSNRIKLLVASGRITPDYAKKKLLPKLEGFQLSLDSESGKPLPTLLDELLDSLEALPENGLLKQVSGQGKGQGKKSNGSQMSVAVEADLPEGLEGSTVLNEGDEGFDDMVAAQLANSGYAPAK